MMTYLDSCIVISLVTGSAEIRQLLRSESLRQGEPVHCVSGLVRSESLVDPYRRQDIILQRRYQTYFEAVEEVELHPSIWDLAARIRAESRLKLPDALHIAIAEMSGCDVFWTADSDYRSIRYPLRIKILITQL